jgi:signal transduction histidine kinase
LLKSYNCISDFLGEEINDPDFFMTGESVYIKSYENFTDSVYRIFNTIRLCNGEKVESNIPQLDTFMYAISNQETVFKEVQYLLQKRGFKDYGMVGVMRNYAHEIEDNYNYFPSELLMLRRHEKDYIIRREDIYIQKFNHKATILKNKINALSTNHIEKDKTIEFIDSYVNLFNQVVETDKTLGFYGSSGYKQSIRETQNQIQELFESTSLELKERLRDLQKRYMLFVYSSVFLLLIMGIVISYLLAKKITKPLTELSVHINQFIKNKFSNGQKPLQNLRNDELGKLYYNFNLLKKELNNHIEWLKSEKEVAEKANELKSIFVAKISHEVRTPISGVVSMTKLLEKTSLNEDQKLYVDTINYSGNHMLKIVNDILDFSKIESGALELENINFDLYKESKKIIQFLNYKAKAANISLSLDIDDNVPLFIKGDPLRITQVLNNLITNALKFTLEGEVKVRIKCTKETEDFAEIIFEVSDTGIGIPDDTINKLFRPYQQAGKSITRNYGGTGLGLVISKELVALMNGEIGVRSKIEKGSTFWFSIPFKKAEEDYYASLTEKERKLIKGKKFLILENDPGYLKNMKHKLEKINAEVKEATCKNEVLSLAKENSFDYIIIDIVCASIENEKLHEYFSLLKKNSSAIVVTIPDYDDTFSKALTAARVDIVMVKPFKIKELVRKIESKI